ncbi:hypothetical protein [Mesorhizobium sp. CO1-1-8]|uniref:hypothetical protein n=1 Tax=Mesorhizobium sp. CO1-1-8 TaxID=2876631 RepID=UPI001CD08FFC|nr:hypothetical protein [Mesorhizobium sp. CO1-1-8]MBZ9776900.1 hypothetical protein [Mesorhizobium sp. CO1-1-8]
MKGRGWIRLQRVADAQAIRKKIALLEQELIAARTDKHAKLHEIGLQLRAYKSQLERLELCISALQSLRSAQVGMSVLGEH